LEARIIKVKYDTEKQKLETQMLVDGYKRKGTDLVLNKGFRWLFFIGFGSIFIIYIFIIFIILYIIYIIYYFKTREKDRVRIIVDAAQSEVNTTNSIIFCSKCKNQLKPDDLFCSKCGNKIDAN